MSEKNELDAKAAFGAKASYALLIQASRVNMAFRGSTLFNARISQQVEFDTVGDFAAMYEACEEPSDITKDIYFERGGWEVFSDNKTGFVFRGPKFKQWEGRRVGFKQILPTIAEYLAEQSGGGPDTLGTAPLPSAKK